METKISAQSNENAQRFVVKFSEKDLQDMGWKNSDIIRVISKKKENKIILKKVANKYAKQVAYTITSTGRGSFSFSSGIFVKYRKNRFAAPPSNGKSDIAISLKKGSCLEISMPEQVFQI